MKKTRTVIDEFNTIINSQEFHIIIDEFYDGRLSHYEYYVGVSKDNRYFKDIKNIGTKDNKGEGWEEPTDNNIKRAVAYTDKEKLKLKLKELCNIFPDDKTIKVLEHAWLSYSGNHYEFLKDDFFYYGGGMYIPTFGKEPAFNAAEIGNKLLLDFLSK
jgi:hypothetical protein